MNDDRVPAPRRGWSSQGLRVIDVNDERYWSVFDATVALRPTVTEEQVANMIKLVNLQPAGKRHGGSRRRHVRVYLASDILAVYEKVADLLIASAEVI